MLWIIWKSNTPEQAPIEEKPYEDSFHAALNAYFLISFTDTFGYDVVSQDVIQGVRQTAASICTEQGCSDTIEPLNSNDIYTASLWATAMGLEDRDSVFAQQLLKTNMFSIVEFDNQLQLYGFSRFIDMDQGGSLSVQTKQRMEDGNWEETKRVVAMEQIPRYAEKFAFAYAVQ